MRIVGQALDAFTGIGLRYLDQDHHRIFRTYSLCDDQFWWYSRLLVITLDSTSHLSRARTQFVPFSVSLLLSLLIFASRFDCTIPALDINSSHRINSASRAAHREISDVHLLSLSVSYASNDVLYDDNKDSGDSE